MKRTERILSISVVGLLIVGYFIGVRWFYGSFLLNTYINGVNISGKSSQEAVTALTEQDQQTLKINERNGMSETIDLKEIDYTADYRNSVNDIIRETNSWTWPVSLIRKTVVSNAGEISFDDEKLKNAVHQLNAVSGEGIQAPRNAFIGYEDGKYRIMKEDDGNTLMEDKTIAVIREALTENRSSVNLDSKECYLNAEVRENNSELRERFSKLKDLNYETITVNIVDGNEMLYCDQILDLVTFDKDKKITVNDTALKEYVNTLADRYNTFRKKRPFTTTGGNTIEIGGGKYDTFGFSMDRDETVNRLKTAILAKKDDTVNAAWYMAGVNRKNGTDIGGTYVEVSIPDQHLWYYRGGELVMDCNVVTGLTNGVRNTPTGVFKIQSKTRNATLRGIGYATPVSFWMPITGGVGLHDANWRGSFGGSIYLSNGSHGCVNMPSAKAEELFNSVAQFTPVIIY